jgi:hypothetical protein
MSERDRQVLLDGKVYCVSAHHRDEGLCKRPPVQLDFHFVVPYNLSS